MLVVAVLAPVLLSVYLAHHRAEQRYHEELDHFAARAIVRANQIIGQIYQAVDEIKSHHYEGCSDADYNAMRDITHNYGFVSGVFYQQNGYITCSSLEKFNHGETLGKPDYADPGGFSLWYESTALHAFRHPMLYIGKSPYIVGIEPQSLIDVIPFGNQPINIAMVGLDSQQIIVSNSPLNPEIWLSSLKAGVNEFQNQGITYAISRDDKRGMAMITWMTSSPITQYWYLKLIIWLPVGIAFSLAARWYINRLLRRSRSLRTSVVYALKNREFSVEYQPIIDLRNGRTVGAEALVRWKQQDGSWIRPDIFIPLAEETGLITQITEQVIDNLFLDLGEWLHNHPEHHISVNLSSYDVHSLHVLTMIQPYLARYGVKPEQIALELTERSFAEMDVIAPVLAQLRKAGHAIYIDDFGTGYSSLSYLQNLDVDVLKIDRSFVNTLDAKVTPHIIAMAKTLQIEIVAEGVETVEQATWLREQGVQYGQGWLYSKALPKETFIAWVADNNTVNKPIADGSIVYVS
ncbi:MAG TPA: EAL domain-containing protein [Buttiauxella sp.]|nr:EAL domain-containing protein [Buttiauxella sp.]